ncbi:MAG: flavodoxin [Catenisphaera adipataccumulans]|jgi:putative NADPH-quinone reductase|uniref:flavodoxin n=1 Tax=Catenisphaera adipataccumulans TaxID=700500 RepID=UPI003D8A4B39
MKKLVVYFSASGITRQRAEELAAAVHADLEEIKPAVSYTPEDLDWRNKQSRSSLEMTNESSRPAISNQKRDLSAYDTIYIGFPIWWGVAPRVVNTYMEMNDLAGKDIMIFATSGGSPIGYALDHMKKTYPELHFVGGKRLSGPVTEDIL